MLSACLLILIYVGITNYPGGTNNVTVISSEYNNEQDLDVKSRVQLGIKDSPTSGRS